MQLAVMDPANRDCELVAHASPERTRLCKREVMRIRWHAATHKAGLSEHEPAVLLVAQPNRFAQSMDHVAARLVPPRTFVGRNRIRHADGQYALAREGSGAATAQIVRRLRAAEPSQASPSLMLESLA